MKRESRSNREEDLSAALADTTTQLQLMERYRYIAMFPFSMDPQTEQDIYDHLARFLVRDHAMGEAAWLYKLDDQRIDLAAQLGLPKTPAPLQHLSRGMGSTVGRCLSVHEPRLIRDCAHEPAYPPPLYPEPTVGSVICAHMTSNSVCFGAMWLYSSVPNFYGSDQRDQLQALATVVAFTINRLRLQKKLEWLADHDELTELPHRRGLRKLVGAVKQRKGHRRAVLFVDIDDFKQYNSQNHELGDQVIREVGIRLRGLVGKQDVVGRWSGDEFLLVVSAAPEARQTLCEGIVASLMSHPAAGQDVSISLGAAWWENGPLESAVKLADDALRKAKAHGKGRATMAD